LAIAALVEPREELKGEQRKAKRGDGEWRRRQ
jgi:hypothetical protein